MSYMHKLASAQLDEVKFGSLVNLHFWLAWVCPHDESRMLQAGS